MNEVESSVVCTSDREGALLSSARQMATDFALLGKLRFAYAVFFALFFTLWMAVPLLGHQEVPGDNYEQLDWALAPALGYTKHPPFPTWVLWSFEQFLPASVELTYVLGALQVGIVLATVWLLTREVLGARQAWVSALFVSCISYYTTRMHFYNHNTALLVASVGATYTLWRAVKTNHLGWWVALGLCWGIGVICKYQMVVTIACNLIFLASIRPQMASLWRRGLLSAAVAALIVLPHFTWLVIHHFPSFAYASKSLAAHARWSDRPLREAKFLADQTLRLVNLLLVLGVLGLVHRVRGKSVAEFPPPMPDSKRFLLIHAFGPLVIMVLLSVFFGVELQMHWGTAFLWAIPLWILSTSLGRRIGAMDLQTILLCVAGAQIAMAAGSLLGL